MPFFFSGPSRRHSRPEMTAKRRSHSKKQFPEPLMPILVFANHDRTRLISRLGGSIEKAKLLALFQFTCRGIPFTYFGDEHPAYPG